MFLTALVGLLVNIAFMGLSYLLFRPKRSETETGPEAEFKLSATKLGASIPVIFGIAKVGGLIIEWGDWTPVRHEKKVGGK